MLVSGTFPAPPLSLCCPQNLFKRCLLGSVEQQTWAVFLELYVLIHPRKNAVVNNAY